MATLINTDPALATWHRGLTIHQRRGCNSHHVLMAVVSLLEEPSVLTSRILLHARRGDGAAAFWAEDDGIVFSGATGAKAFAHRSAVGSTQQMSLDAERYLQRPDSQLSLLDEAVAAAQDQALRRVAMFLAPSGPGGQDLSEMRSVLDAGERFLEAAACTEHAAPAYIPLVVGPKWRSSLLDDLCALLASRQLPIAFLFASPFDPLATTGDVQAALQLAASVRDGIVLRCDLGSIGLVASGLQLGSVGATPDLRHVFIPLRRRRGGDVHKDRSLYVYLPALQSWLRGSQLTYVDSSLEIFQCNCRVCDGRSVLRFSEGRADLDALRDEAEAHGALSWRGLVDRVLTADRSQWVANWLDECGKAEDNFRLLRTEGVALQSPGYLSAWTSALS